MVMENIKNMIMKKNLLFEGRYINGEKKGKEYKDKELIFDGYYLNDKRWSGKIKDYRKEYHFRCGYGRDFEKYGESESKYDIEFKNMKDYENNIIKYEGEYIDGKRSGKGKEYDINGKIIFEFDFISGDRRSKRYKYDKADYYVLKYEGEILEGQRNGKGIEYDDYGRRIIFEGEFLKGYRWNGKYKEYDNKTKIIIEKEYINGEIIEDDKYKSNDKLIYKNENNLNDNKTEGVIKEFFEESDKIRFEGVYLKNEKWNGIMHNKNDNFKIEIKDGKWNLKESNLKIKYLGEDIYIIQDINGIIKEYYNGYLIYEGEYLNDKRNGRGKEFDISGNITFEGEYKNGNRWNGKIKELIIPMYDEI